MSSSELEFSRLHRVRTTVFEMLKDRGYVVGDEDLNMSLASFTEKFSDNSTGTTRVGRMQLTIVTHETASEAHQIAVYFASDPKVGVKPIREYCEFMNEGKILRAIIVVQEGLTPFAKTAVSELRQVLELEVFTEAELVVNVTKHVLVPKHSVLSSDEKNEVLSRYMCSEAQLPRIQMADPVARYYGLKRGQVVRIIRDSETAGRYTTFRLCV